LQLDVHDGEDKGDQDQQGLQEANDNKGKGKQHAQLLKQSCTIFTFQLCTQASDLLFFFQVLLCSSMMVLLSPICLPMSAPTTNVLSMNMMGILR
jgi:hypothetical protein